MQAMRLLIAVLILTAVCGPTPAIGTTTSHETEVAILTGRLQGKVTTLGFGPRYSLRGTFIVPAGAELHIRWGVAIWAEPGSKLIVEGKLETESKGAHIIVRSARPGQSWQGILLRRCESAQLAFVEIRDATDGLATENTPDVELTDCTLERNGTALRIGTDSACVVKNCLFATNKRGIVLDGGRIEMSACTLSDNSEMGIESDGGTATVSDSLISNNRQGTFKISGESTFAVHNCSIRPGMGSCVVVATETQQDFTQNWWGETETRVLQKGGATVNVPWIVDGLDQRGRGRALVVPFLSKAPEPCGADLKRPLSVPPAGDLVVPKVRIFEQNTRIVFTKPSYLITDERFRDTFRKVLLDNNAGEVTAYVQAGVAVKVTEDTFATVVAYRDSMYWVKVINGPAKDKQGLAWWQDVAEALAVDATDFVGKQFIWRERESKDWRTSRLSSVITFLEGGSTKEDRSPDRDWEITPGGYLILMDSRFKTQRKITDRFTQARREDGLLVLTGTSTYAHGEGIATLEEMPDTSEGSDAQ
jgi:hypothetical protein